MRRQALLFAALLMVLWAGVVEAEIVPKTAPVYSLVTIKTATKADFYDVQIMTVQKGAILFVRAVETKQPGTWVFTGPPGSYSVRVSTFHKDKGFSAEVGSVVIGKPPKPDPDDPDPPDPPDDKNVPNDRFDNLGKSVFKWVDEFTSDNFPRQGLGEAYLDAAARLEGSKEPVVGTITQMFEVVKKYQEDNFTEQHKQEWNSVREGINKTWTKFREQIDRTAAIEFYRAVGNGLAPPSSAAPNHFPLVPDGPPNTVPVGQPLPAKKERTPWDSMSFSERAMWLDGSDPRRPR